MTNPLLIAILAGLGGMVGWGLADFFAKFAVDRVGPIRSLVWAHLFGAIGFTLIALVQIYVLNRSVPLPNGGSAWLSLIGFGVLQMLVYLLAYSAFEKGKVAVLNPIFASYAGIVALGSVIFFGEHLRVGLGIALLMIFGGLLLLNLDFSELGNSRLNAVAGLKEILGATVLAAVWTLGWDRFIGGHDSVSYALWMYVFMSLAALLLAVVMRVKLLPVDGKLWKFLVFMGASETLAYLTISWGYSATDKVSVVALISGAFSVPTVVLAYIFLKERLTTYHWAAIAVIIGGIAVVALT